MQLVDFQSIRNRSPCTEYALHCGKVLRSLYGVPMSEAQGSKLSVHGSQDVVLVQGVAKMNINGSKRD